LERGLTVREVEKAAKPTDPKPKSAPKPRPELDPNDEALQDALSTFLGGPVRLERDRDRSRLVVEFYSDDDLQRVLDQIGFRMP
jgi:ParB family chromosome partitioning protein